MLNLRVLRPVTPLTADRHANDQRTRIVSPKRVVPLRRLGDNGIHRIESKLQPAVMDDRPQAADRCTDCHTGKCGLAARRIVDLFGKAFRQSGCRPVRAIGIIHAETEDMDARIRERNGGGFLNRLGVGENALVRHRRHLQRLLPLVPLPPLPSPELP